MVKHQKCETCGKVDVEYYTEHPATKDCFDCADKALRASEAALMSVLTTDEQKELFKQYQDVAQARSTVLLSMS